MNGDNDLQTVEQVDACMLVSYAISYNALCVEITDL